MKNVQNHKFYFIESCAKIVIYTPVHADLLPPVFVIPILCAYRLIIERTLFCSMP